MRKIIPSTLLTALFISTSAFCSNLEDSLTIPAPQNPVHPATTMSEEEKEIFCNNALKTLREEIKEKKDCESRIKYYQSVVEDSTRPLIVRILSRFYLARSYLRNHAPDNREEMKAVKTFRRVLASKDLTREYKVLSAYYLAYMHLRNNALNITDEEAVEYFQLTKDAPVKDATIAFQKKATYYIAFMHFEGRAPNITDAQAAEYFQSTIENDDSNLRFLATYFLARMRLLNKAQNITDAQAEEYFLSVLTNVKCRSADNTNFYVDTAAYYLAGMFVSNRAHNIDYDQHLALLEQAFKSKHILSKEKIAIDTYMKKQAALKIKTCMELLK